MMNCKEVTESLLRFRDGELGPEDTEVLRQHLHLCPPCMDLFDGYDEIVAVLERLRPVNMPSDFLERMKCCLKEREGKTAEEPEERPGAAD